MPTPPHAPDTLDAPGASAATAAGAGGDASDAERILELPPRRAASRLAAAPMPAPAAGRMVSLHEAAQQYVAGLGARSRGARRAEPASGAVVSSGRESPAERRDAGAGEGEPRCPICQGAGYVRLDVPLGDPSFGQAVPCVCKERQREERRRGELDQLSSLAPFRGKTFESFDPRVPGLEEAFTVARRYATEMDGWLVLRGGYGIGKTHLAAAIANYQLAQGTPVFFSAVPDLLDHLRAAFAPASEVTYDALFDRIREVELLVLDDLGAENATAWATEKLFQLINYRYNFRMPTVFTTNHKLLSHLDERIRSRLSDLSLVRQVTVEAQDYRERYAGRAPRAKAPYQR